jgi:23S rRNA (adenine2503-C2)-methyltransferase
MPLEEKWVITLSTQYGCSMGCTFCDVPKVGPGINATLKDLCDQVYVALMAFPNIQCTKRLNIHYARMGEPTFNPNVLTHAKGLMKEIKPFLGRSLVHPVVSTMMPRNNKNLIPFLQDWCEIKNDHYRGCAGLQLSINSTNHKQREEMFAGSALQLESISMIGKSLPTPNGRKYALNFALADDYEINAEYLRTLFDPNKFMCKITPMHITTACKTNSIETTGGYDQFTPYKQTEKALKDQGFDVIVFIPSIEEDLSRITCGNAILSDGK